MGFEHEELEPPEIAALSVEYLRTAARWLEDASRATTNEEVRRALASAGRSTRDFHDGIEARVRDRYGNELPETGGLSDRIRSRSDIVPFHDLEPDSPAALLEVASTEEEEAYQYFLGVGDEIDDSWLQALFAEIAEHTRSVVLYLEAERETLADAEGRG